MANKSKDTKKSGKKLPKLTAKEKRAAKRAKKTAAGNNNGGLGLQQ